MSRTPVDKFVGMPSRLWERVGLHVFQTVIANGLVALINK